MVIGPTSFALLEWLLLARTSIRSASDLHSEIGLVYLAYNIA